MDARPIGMFDSGFGGLTVARAVIDLLPDEHLVYVGDTGRYPYGPRDLDEVRGFAHQITRHLVDDHGVKLVVVACNTASAAALHDLQAECAVPVVGVIEPGVRSLAIATRTGRVGVIGTVGTMASGAYQRAVAAVDSSVELTGAACPGFVEFVEKGETRSDQVHVLAERLLAPLRDAKVDTLLLGCTHYPFLARTIGDVMGRDVVLVSSADETAFEVRSLLLGSGMARRRGPGDALARHRWLSSGDVAWFRELGRRLLGPELDRAEPVNWDAGDTGKAGGDPGVGA
jgi:glutamate racemase